MCSAILAVPITLIVVTSVKNKTNNIYKDNILYNTKANLEKGEFYVFYENKNTLEEISALIKFVKGKNIDIVNINRLLE